jgi:hypothetical protein
MKKALLACIFTIVSLFFVGCPGGVELYEPIKVETKLSYKDMVGTYIFRPDKSQAKKLGISFGDTVVLNITDKKTQGFKGDSSIFYGEYNINKMVLGFKKETSKPYKGTWEFFFNKYDTAGSNRGSNNIKFYIKNVVIYDFDIERDDDGVLHMAAFVQEPSYEIFKLIDFKKVK